MPRRQASICFIMRRRPNRTNCRCLQFYNRMGRGERERVRSMFAGVSGGGVFDVCGCFRRGCVYLYKCDNFTFDLPVDSYT